MSEEKFEIKNGWLITECLCLKSNHELTGSKADFWLPFSIRIDKINGFKLSTLDEDDSAFLTTTIYACESLDYFNVNINYETFKKEVMNL